MKTKILLSATICVVVLLLARCHDGTKSLTSAGNHAITVRFNPYPPGDVSPTADALQLSEFAWEEFLALNWKSAYDTIHFMRDMPDTSWSYQDSSRAYPDLNVWETYAHRSELRPYSNTMLPFNSAPHYSYHVKLVADGSASLGLFQNLDENNEIGSCNMFAHTDTFNQKYQVLYDAKVNSYEYNYIYNTHNTKEKLFAAANATKSNIARYNAYYPGGKTTCSGPDSVVCLPCGVLDKKDSTGAMEIKAAWRQLTPYEVAHYSNRYFTRNVITYTSGPHNTAIYHNSVYALIALHVIHKTKNYPAFIFATFQQVDVQNAPRESVKYLLLGNKSPSSILQTPVQDSIRSVTEATSRYVHSKLPRNSVWQYYHLVGVQAKPVSYPDTTNQNTNFFLSNYVVESDVTLGHFNGSGIDTPHNHGKNVLVNAIYYSMGGCQGCHGATQLKAGTDFSFVLDAKGKPVDAPDNATSGGNPGKLQMYISAFQAANIRIAQIKHAAAKSKPK